MTRTFHLARLSKLAWRTRESIKALIAGFYADNFAELDRLNLATTVEEFYTKL